MKHGARWIRRAMLLFGLVSALAPATAGQSIENVVGERWGTEEGLPHSAVTALLQSRDGYLWVGTAAGLARFDGLRFTPISDERAPHLRSEERRVGKRG